MLCLEAVAVGHNGRLGQGVAMLEGVLGQQKVVLGPDDADTLETRGIWYWHYALNGGAAEAIPLLHATLTACEAKLGVGHSLTVATRDRLAVSLPLRRPSR